MATMALRGSSLSGWLAGMLVGVSRLWVGLSCWSLLVGALPLSAVAEATTQADSAADLVKPATLAEMLELDEAALAKVDLARMNLLCAEGLPGAEKLDVDACCALLDRWAFWVGNETLRHLYRFQRNPAEFRNSEGDFRMLLLVGVLQQDYAVHYNAARITTPDNPESDAAFFANAADVFLPGLLGSDRAGTCASMPVLYAAVARRLGYPVKLTTAKMHLFARWDGNGERFNIEGSGRGYESYPDEYYHNWPLPMTPAEIAGGQYLLNLGAKEELAIFLEARGHVLRVHGQFEKAREAFQQAQKLTPGRPEHGGLVALMQRMEAQGLTMDAERARFLAWHRRLSDQLVPEPSPYVIWDYRTGRPADNGLPQVTPPPSQPGWPALPGQVPSPFNPATPQLPQRTP